MNKFRKAAGLIEDAIDLLEKEVPEEDNRDLNTMIEILGNLAVDLCYMGDKGDPKWEKKKEKKST